MNVHLTISTNYQTKPGTCVTNICDILEVKELLTGLTEFAGFGLASGGQGTGRATMGALVAAVKMNTVKSLVRNMLDLEWTFARD